MKGLATRGAGGVRTHQLLLAVLAASATGRVAVPRELLDAARHAGRYRGSHEELTPVRGDPLAALAVALATAAALVHPPSWRWFAGGAVANYALTPHAWTAILASASDPSDQTPG